MRIAQKNGTLLFHCGTVDGVQRRSARIVPTFELFAVKVNAAPAMVNATEAGVKVNSSPCPKKGRAGLASCPGSPPLCYSGFPVLKIPYQRPTSISRKIEAGRLRWL